MIWIEFLIRNIRLLILTLQRIGQEILSIRNKRSQHNSIIISQRYLLQGIPLGLVMGSLPYLLQPHVSFTSLGFFSLATYPYSLKLFWSPIVDAVYNEKWGRRKSWIIPIQIAIGICLLWISYNIQNWIGEAEMFLKQMTVAFFILVFLCATQDIVVDGWVLTLLSEENLAYASTAQSVGLNTGYFLSFTVFLAFNSSEFVNKYFYFVKKDFGLMTLGGYMWFWGWVFLISTVFIAFFQNETKEKCSSGGIKSVYLTIFDIMKLQHARLFIFIHLIAKIGFSASDATLNLKLLEKGLKKEDLSAAILINFPLELIFGYYTARWSSMSQPLLPWIYAYIGRLIAASIGIFIVHIFPYDGKIDSIYFYIIILQNMLSSFMSINAFHTRIADPMIGGTYMTLLNTVCNLGGTWPRYFILEGMDFFTKSYCSEDTMNRCITDKDITLCRDLRGHCIKSIDGYYVINFLSIFAGTLLFFLLIKPSVEKLQRLPLKAWKIFQVNIVSFKLETDVNLLITKAKESLYRYKYRLVIEFWITLIQMDRDNGIEIESKILRISIDLEGREVSPITPSIDRLTVGNSTGSPLSLRYSVETTPTNSPLRVRRRREPILFNILVIGFHGSGKTTFIKFLREQLDTVKHQQCSEMNEIGKYENQLDQEFTQYCADMELDGERITVTLWDSSGLGVARDDNIVDLQMNEVMLFVESKFEDTFSEYIGWLPASIKERCLEKKKWIKIMDTHIHCVFYLIDPTSSYFRYNLAADSLDVSIIQRLSKCTTVIPIISKVDTCTKHRIENIKFEWMKEMEKNGIKFLEFLRDSEDSTDESGSEYSQDSRDEMYKLLPFGCMSPDWTHESFLSSEKKIIASELCREYPWGKANPLDEKHCDFIKLKEMVFGEWRNDMREFCKEVLYENWRTDRLEKLGNISPKTKPGS
ncbi:hypothetical protein PCANB_002258 [Pneumocystis canis]|nr:hypothetical protein PCANB_002258 [Pneumocystis canis]